MNEEIKEIFQATSETFLRDGSNQTEVANITAVVTRQQLENFHPDGMVGIDVLGKEDFESLVGERHLLSLVPTKQPFLLVEVTVHGEAPFDHPFERSLVETMTGYLYEYSESLRASSSFFSKVSVDFVDYELDVKGAKYNNNPHSHPMREILISIIFVGSAVTIVAVVILIRRGRLLSQVHRYPQPSSATVTTAEETYFTNQT